MKISHEVPRQLLAASRWFNDYDYALVHLFDKYPGYYQFYKDSVDMGRTVYLDNSLYELGESFSASKFREWINKLHPTHYIMPDTFWDTQKTMYKAMDWMLNYEPSIPKGIKKIGVCQGSCYEDMVKCYRFMAGIADVVAFTFKFPVNFVENSKDFEEYSIQIRKNLGFEFDDIRNPYNGNEDAIKQAYIRFVLLSKLEYDGVIDKTKQHHLLGLQNTFMLSYINERFPWLTSIDTSNPIISGYMGRPYKLQNNGLGCREVGNIDQSKPSKVLADYFDDPFPTDKMDMIKFNVMAFRELAGDDVEKWSFDLK